MIECANSSKNAFLDDGDDGRSMLTMSFACLQLSEWLELSAAQF